MLKSSSMYVQTWVKYMPVIKILIKRTSKSEQVFNLNSTDFQPPGASKKGGQKFSIHFRKGFIVNNISTSLLAKDLADVLKEDEDIRSLLSNGDYLINLNTKNQLSIKLLAEDEKVKS